MFLMFILTLHPRVLKAIMMMKRYFEKHKTKLNELILNFFFLIQSRVSIQFIGRFLKKLLKKIKKIMKKILKYLNSEHQLVTMKQ
jgi:hypothetical protein